MTPTQKFLDSLDHGNTVLDALGASCATMVDILGIVRALDPEAFDCIAEQDDDASIDVIELLTCIVGDSQAFKVYASNSAGTDPVVAYPATIEGALTAAQLHHDRTGHDRFAVGCGTYLARIHVWDGVAHLADY